MAAASRQQLSFRQLAAAGLITQTATRPRRGAVEHFYRLTVRARIVAEHV